MALGSHIILSAYGFWLPNDPRGSWSDFVGAYELYRFGCATKMTSRLSVAGALHDAKARLAAKKALKYPLMDSRPARSAAGSRNASGAPISLYGPAPFFRTMPTS